jgi:hypothetical protein
LICHLKELAAALVHKRIDMHARIASVALLVVNLAFSIAANAAGNRDGNWWNQLGENQKLAYAVRFLDGQTYAQLSFTGAALYGMADPKTGKYDPIRAKTAKDVAQFADDQIKSDFGNVTAGQLAAGLDKIYSDYRNMRIAVTGSIIVVVRSIGGMSDDEMAKMLENKRKAAAE